MNLLEVLRSKGSRAISERVEKINKAVAEGGEIVIAGETLPPGPKHIGWGGNSLRVAVQNGTTEAKIYKVAAIGKSGEIKESTYIDKAFDPREW